jgi:hypothetical protein
MRWILKVSLTTPSPDLVHEFRNFGEEVYHELRAQCGVSIDEIDASTSEFHLREIYKRNLRTIAAKVRKTSKRYRSLGTVVIFETS